MDTLTYQDNKEEIETSVTAVYDKLSGIDTVTSRALVQETAKQMDESVRAMSTRGRALRGKPDRHDSFICSAVSRTSAREVPVSIPLSLS